MATRLCVERWWDTMDHAAYPTAIGRSSTITTDAGGTNAYRSTLFTQVGTP